MARTPDSLEPTSQTWMALGEMQQLLLEGHAGVALVIGLDGRLRWLNAAARQVLGWAPEDVVGKAVAGTLVGLEEMEARAAQLSAALGERVAADASLFEAGLRERPPLGPAKAHDWVLRARDGQPHAVRLATGPLRDHQGRVTALLAVEPLGPVGVDELPPLSHHDRLTGLPTRAVLQDRAEMALLRAARQQTVLALVLVELAGFEAACEQYGHSVGDDVLRATASRLHFELRRTDTAVRLDRGQFAAMLVDLNEGAEATLVADKIVKSLAGTINVGVTHLAFAPRVGVAWFPAHGDQLLPLLQLAERALQTLPADEGGVVVAPAAE